MESPESEKIDSAAILQSAARTIPGTVYLVDIQRRSRAKHSTENRDIILVPAPTDDPDDPLNWSKRRKILSTVCTSSYVFLLGLSTASIYSVIVPVSRATGLTVNEINQGTGYMFLLLGWACLFWQPVALQYGKRLTYLVSLAGTLGIMIWQAHATTSGQYLASKILQGFFGAPIESLCEISIADIWFQHERGKYFALYGFLLAGSNYFAPFFMGFINDGQGWQWVFYWSAIFCAISFVFNFFFMEETNWDRVAEDKPRVDPGHASGIANPFSGNKNVEGGDVKSVPMKSRKSFVQKMSLRPHPKPFRLFKIFLRPLLYFSFPAVVWSGFSYGLSLVFANAMNATASSIYSGPHYRFTPSAVGLTYLSPFIGSMISALYSGNLGDWFALRMARKNNGIMEAEHRLWLFGVSCVIMPFALILWGVGAAHHIHWFGIVFAHFIKGLQSSMGISLSLTYTLDSYRDIGGEAVVTVILIRNTMSFAMNFAITPWVNNLGLQNAFIIAAVASVVGFLTFLPMILYGKTLRERSAERYGKFVEQEKQLGLVH